MAIRVRVLDRLLPTGGFGRNVAKIAGGTLLGQGAVILVMPLLTRIYAPSEFGLLGVYASLLSLLLVAATFRLELAVPIPKEDGEAAQVLGLGLLGALLSAAGVPLALALAGGWITGKLRVPELRPYLWWILPLGILGGGAYQMLSGWALRKQDYPALARTRLRQGIAQALTQLGVGLAVKGSLGLLIGADVGRWSGMGTLFRRTLQGSRQALRGIRIGGMKTALNRFRDFPLVGAGSALLNAGGLYLPPILIASLYGAAVGGQFALAQRTIAVPLSLLGQAMGQVYLAELSVAIRTRPEQSVLLYRDTLFKLTRLGIVPFLVLLLISPLLVPKVFGQQWIFAGKITQILSVMFLLQFISSPLSASLLLLEKQGIQLSWDLARFVLVVFSVVLSYRFFPRNPITMIFCYAACMTLAYIALIWIINRQLINGITKRRENV